MRTSHKGRAAIAREEACVLPAYQDAVGVWTIGIGHTSAAGPPKVAARDRITLDEAWAIFARDLATFEAAVAKSVKVSLLQHEFDALVSLCYNIGGGAFRKSTLVKRLNAGDREGASAQFGVWNKAGGRTLQGLTDRRRRERAIFDRAEYGETSIIPVYQSWPGHPIGMGVPKDTPDIIAPAPRPKPSVGKAEGGAVVVAAGAGAALAASGVDWRAWAGVLVLGLLIAVGVLVWRRQR